MEQRIIVILRFLFVPFFGVKDVGLCACLYRIIILGGETNLKCVYFYLY